ncbi:MAG: hypothetical protein HYS26_04385 [Candidatus Kaiserbacteria bacterium]|nr:MAG: hypothetical protein HYS26_04385 [Candidatus Kaiserbacteria bacterium]
MKMIFGGLLLAALSATPSNATVVITNDPGGRIEDYVKRLSSLRAQGEEFIIDGPCISACTLIVAIIPLKRVCATGRSTLGFHAAWNPGWFGQQVPNAEATRALMKRYPRHVRRVIAKNGGLTSKMFFVSAAEVGISQCR